MSTVNRRLTIIFLLDIAALLKEMTGREKKLVASLTKKLVINALGRREAVELSRLADICEHEQKGKKPYSCPGMGR